MSYGQNQPWGLLPIRNLGSSTWNGQVTPYFIASGYANNIFKGDLVFQGADGFIHNFSEYGVSPATQAALGVFWGCSFQTSVATNPIDPASPGRAYWPAGTVTLNNVNATAFIIDDPNVIYNVQSDATGVPFSALGDNATVTYTASPNPTGNTNTGASSMVLNATSGIGHEATRTLRMRALVPVPGNDSGIAYNNVEVLIQNHSLAQRAAGL